MKNSKVKLTPLNCGDIAEYHTDLGRLFPKSPFAYRCRLLERFVRTFQDERLPKPDYTGMK